MMTSGDDILSARRDTRVAQFRGWVLLAVPLGALAFQSYVPLFFEQLKFLDLTLLVTIYFAMMRHSPVTGILIGASMGLAQDALVYNPLGMYGIAKTLVGFFAASLGSKIDVGAGFVRLIACFVFYYFHQFLYWTMSHALLANRAPFEWKRQLMLAGLNTAVGLALFHFLDRLKSRD